MHQIAPGVHHLEFLASNVYLVGEPGGTWAVVDTGIPGHFEQVKNAATDIFGADARPEAIILTHAHMDHYGSALALAAYWDVPVYAHRLEAPYLTGKCKMPPTDPTVGGWSGLAFRLLPESGTDLGDYYRPLPEDGTVPGMPGWEWLHTPGHTPGHISLFRKEDRCLIAGDALATVNLNSVVALATKRQKLSGPPAPATYDWEAVRDSLRKLAALHPQTIAAGHGVPMSGPDLAEDLEEFAEAFHIPFRGRYVPEPAVTDEEGVQYVPPPAPDPLPKVAAGVAIAAVLIGIGMYARRRRNGAERDV